MDRGPSSARRAAARRRGQERPRERDLLLHAPREVLHRLVASVRGKPTRSRIAGIFSRVCPRSCRNEPRSSSCSDEHLLEEQPPRPIRGSPSAARRGAPRRRRGRGRSPSLRPAEERREQADERRLPRAVLAEDGDGLTRSSENVTPSRAVRVRFPKRPFLRSRIVNSLRSSCTSTAAPFRTGTASMTTSCTSIT